MSLFGIPGVSILSINIQFRDTFTGKGEKLGNIVTVPWDQGRGGLLQKGEIQCVCGLYVCVVCVMCLLCVCVCVCVCCGCCVCVVYALCSNISVLL